MRNLQRGVTHFTRLLTENGTQQTLLRGQLGLALRGDLANEDVARMNLCADADDAALIQILERVLTDVRNVAGNFFRPKLGVAGFNFVFLNMD